MKILLLTSLIASASICFAKDIQGVLVLKGSLKTKVEIFGEKTTCKVKIDKVKNILDEEDSFGNPAYQIQAKIELTGNDKVKYENEVTFINLFKNGNISQVDDLNYFAKNAPTVTMKVNNEGRLVKVSFTTRGQAINCNF